MTATELLQDLRRQEIEFQVDGERLRYRPLAKVSPELREEIHRHRDELFRLIHPEAYAALARSECAARCRAAWPWIADHRPDLLDRVMQADWGPNATDLASFEAALRAGVEAFEATHPRSGAARVYIPSTDREVWIIGDEADVAPLMAAVRAEGDGRAVFTVAEVEKLAYAPTELLADVERVKRIIGGRVRLMGPVEEIA
jgi:hypothetical protein